MDTRPRKPGLSIYRFLQTTNVNCTAPTGADVIPSVRVQDDAMDGAKFPDSTGIGRLRLEMATVPLTTRENLAFFCMIPGVHLVITICFQWKWLGRFVWANVVRAVAHHGILHSTNANAQGSRVSDSRMRVRDHCDDTSCREFSQ